jgi:DNA replication protein DnaC
MGEVTFVKQPDLLALPKRFISAELDDKTNASLKAVANEFTTNFSKYYSLGLAPMFLGNPGVGKTHVAAAIANTLDKEKNVPVYWADAVRTLNNLMDYRDFRDKSYFALKEKVLRTPFVIVDDFGHLQRYARTRELFFEIVNARYASRLPTLFTANFEVGQSVESWGVIDSCFGPAMTRRFRVMCKGLLFLG